MTVEGNVIKPDEGKKLFNGEVASDCVHLGKFDSADNWQEIDADTDISTLIETDEEPQPEIQNGPEMPPFMRERGRHR